MSKIVTYENGQREVRDMTSDEIAELEPSTNPRDYRLTHTQWFSMVRRNGLYPHIRTIAAKLEETDLDAWDALERALSSDSFGFEKTLAQMIDLEALLDGIKLPKRTALTTMWLSAAKRNGHK